MQTLIKFEKFVNDIIVQSGSTYKKTVLEKYKDDEDIKYYLNYIFNPYKVTGISDKKLARQVTVDVTKNAFDTVKELLEYIAKNNTGKDSVLEQIELFRLEHFRNEDSLWSLLCAIITKNLPIGVDAKTINKVIPGCIPTFNVQLANKYFDNPNIVNGKEFTLTTKIDGGRIIAIKENGAVKFYTRAGQEYTGLVDLEAEMLAKMPDNIALDGEITLLDRGNLVSKDQYKRTMEITRTKGEKHGVKMLVFDMMTAEEFRNQKCDTPYVDRRKNLEALFATPFIYFNLLPVLYSGTDTNEIGKWLNHNITHGEEGAMININNAPYDFKRTNNLLKVKKMQDIDLECIGFEEGTGKYRGTLGALLVDFNGNTVKVGSGLSDQLRDEIWTHQAEWLGRTIVVQYFEVSKDAKGKESLRFPIYIDYREDK